MPLLAEDSDYPATIKDMLEALHNLSVGIQSETVTDHKQKIIASKTKQQKQDLFNQLIIIFNQEIPDLVYQEESVVQDLAEFEHSTSKPDPTNTDEENLASSLSTTQHQESSKSTIGPSNSLSGQWYDILRDYLSAEDDYTFASEVKEIIKHLAEQGIQPDPQKKDEVSPNVIQFINKQFQAIYLKYNHLINKSGNFFNADVMALGETLDIYIPGLDYGEFFSDEDLDEDLNEELKPETELHAASSSSSAPETNTMFSPSSPLHGRNATPPSTPSPRQESLSSLENDFEKLIATITTPTLDQKVIHDTAMLAFKFLSDPKRETRHQLKKEYRNLIKKFFQQPEKLPILPGKDLQETQKRQALLLNIILCLGEFVRTTPLKDETAAPPPARYNR